MIIPTLIRANGKLFTRNSCAARVNGLIRIPELDSLDWSDDKPHELVQAMNSGGPPLGKAEGPYACEATLSVYADAASKFELAVLAGSPLAGLNLSAANFQFTVTLSEEIRTRTVIWVNCNIVGRPSRTVGNDGSAIVMQYKIQPEYIIEDGKTLVSLIPPL